MIEDRRKVVEGAIFIPSKDQNRNTQARVAELRTDCNGRECVVIDQWRLDRQIDEKWHHHTVMSLDTFLRCYDYDPTVEENVARELAELTKVKDAYAKRIAHMLGMAPEDAVEAVDVLTRLVATHTTIVIRNELTGWGELHQAVLQALQKVAAPPGGIVPEELEDLLRQVEEEV